MIVIHNKERTYHEAARVILGSLLEDANSKRLKASKSTSDDTSRDDEINVTSREWASLLFDMMTQYLDRDMERTDWVRFIKYSDLRIKDWTTEKEESRLAGAKSAIEELHRMLTLIIDEWGHESLTKFLREESCGDNLPDPHLDNDNLDSDDYMSDPEDCPSIEEEEKEVIYHFNDLSEDLLMIEALLKNYNTQ
tara:strand:+ start:1412 stop:1993 length:582 start_codon:yes stop_codon:yes gene_type:complete